MLNGVYLEGDAASFACGRVPLLLQPCPTCRHAINFTRGLQEIVPSAMLHSAGACSKAPAVYLTTKFPDGPCAGCPMERALAEPSAGLMFVGSRFYPTPESFTEEAARLGVSKRIKWPLPKFVQPGKTWVFLAHEKGHRAPCASCGVPPYVLEGVATGGQGCEACKGKGHTFTPAIFYAFVVKRVVKIVSDAMPEAYLEKIRAQGLEPVIVPDGDPDHRGR